MNLLITCLITSLLAPLLLAVEPIRLVFPTDNTKLIEGKPEEFYMYTHRYVKGVDTKPWTGGQYGYVRNIVNTDIGKMAVKFHEGIDIRPVTRDKKGNPLDQIRAIASGTVVYVNNSSSRSNYGKYLVIQHDWGCGPLYSLYAHLAEIKATVGQKLVSGTPIGIMGYTGEGISKTRAHLHLELGIMLTDNFDSWYRAGNPHKLYHGQNLSGLDIANLLIAQRKQRNLTIPSFLALAKPYYKITLPRKHPLQLATRYPWMKKGNHQKNTPSWEIAFTDNGLPLTIAPSNRIVEKPTVTYVRPSGTKHKHFTSGHLSGQGRTASLTSKGLKHLSLITHPPASTINTP